MLLIVSLRHEESASTHILRCLVLQCVQSGAIRNVLLRRAGNGDGVCVVCMASGVFLYWPRFVACAASAAAG
jgi:hypothetical protein